VEWVEWLPERRARSKHTASPAEGGAAPRAL
jgi:hypothetical protein